METPWRGFWNFVTELPQSKLFESLSRELLREGNCIRFQARGASMSPAIRDGEVVLVEPAVTADLRKGDIVLVKGETGFRLHRLVVADVDRDEFTARGDCGQQNDPALKAAQIVGLARSKEVRVGRKIVRARFQGVGGRALRCAARVQYAAGKLLKGAVCCRSAAKSGISLGILLLLLSAAALLNAQVAFDRNANLAQIHTVLAMGHVHLPGHTRWAMPRPITFLSSPLR